MICTSAADIEDMYVGESEKAIKGLFSLGRMLSPCTIFIDEADALFRSRSPHDRGWERSQINQLLHEIDGLKKSNTPPFVLLASNFPSQLDHAVLRRVPSRIHIGLPSPEARRQIFQIFLADEILDMDVDLHQLVEKSRGYSGSDIQTVCVQAALICDTTVSNGDKRRLMKYSHFEKAFERSAPTVSKTALREIKAFAKEFDPTALNYMQEGDGQRHVPSKRATPDSVGNDNDLSPSPVKRSFTGRQEPETMQDTNYEAWKSKVAWAALDQATAAARVQEVYSPSNETGSDELKESYQYTALKPDSKQIRVLSIQPKKSSLDNVDEDRLSCILTTVDLDDWTSHHQALFPSSETTAGSTRLHSIVWRDPSLMHQILRGSYVCDEFRQRLKRDNALPYELAKMYLRFNWGDYIALSYVWGDGTDRRNILLNGHDFSVTSNLYEALLHLRDFFEVQESKLFVWADAICINQADLAERAAEVKKMDIINSRCQHVRAWLGLPDPAIDLKLSATRDYLDSLRDCGPSNRVEVYEKYGPLIGEVTAHLLSLPYWERLWVLQEMALAPLVFFCYGKVVFTTNNIDDLRLIGRLCALSVCDWSDERGGNEATVLAAENIGQRLEFLRSTEGCTFRKDYFLTVGVLRLAQNSKVTDQRDKVFGLLALLPKSISTEIHPNYDLDPYCTSHDTFTKFSIACFKAEGNISVLARIPKLRPFPGCDLPSWVFDFAGERLVGDTNWKQSLHRIHKANLDLAGKDMSFSKDSRLLFCDGVIVDVLSSLGAGNLLDVTTAAVPSGHEFHIQTTKSGVVIPHRDWKLALARVIAQDSSFEFSECLSVFDIPWFQKTDTDPKFKWDLRTIYDEGRMDWSSFRAKTGFDSQFIGSLRENEAFDIGGKPFKSYFASTDRSVCADGSTFSKYWWMLHQAFFGKRLATTRRGMLGTVPPYARLGDRIVVLSCCDMPVVLRPKGEHYEFIGGCFIEGLMKGEVAKGVKEGRLYIEPLTLC